MRDFTMASSPGDIVSGVITGTCMSMCPPDELLLREREGLLHLLEMKSGTEACRRPTADPSKTVKVYTRSAAGLDVADRSLLRPLEVLEQTVSYLIQCASETDDIPWYEVYNFVFDRMRAVRQDLVIQTLEGETVINILQKILGFILYSSYRLCTEPLANFDPVLNHQDCEVVFQRLFGMLENLQGTYTRQVDIECLCLLYNLGNTNVLARYYSLSHQLRKNRELLLCYKINIAYILGNYVKFFKLLNKLPSTLYLCAIHKNIEDVRGKALKVMSTAYNSKALKYPIRKIRDLLMLNSESEAVLMCQNHGITMNREEACFNKATFRNPEKKSPSHWYLIEKRLYSEHLSDVLQGCDLEMDFTRNCNIER